MCRQVSGWHSGELIEIYTYAENPVEIRIEGTGSTAWKLICKIAETSPVIRWTLKWDFFFFSYILIKGEEVIHVVLLLFIAAGETPSAPRKDKQCTAVTYMTLFPHHLNYFPSENIQSCFERSITVCVESTWIFVFLCFIWFLIIDQLISNGKGQSELFFKSIIDTQL